MVVACACVSVCVQCSTGMGFGELALMYDGPRAATVVATSDVTTWSLDRITFKQVMIGTTQRKARDLLPACGVCSALQSPSESSHVCPSVRSNELCSASCTSRS